MLNEPDVSPCEIVIEDGVVRSALLSEMETVAVDVAALDRVTVQVPLFPDDNVAGVQITEETVTGAVRLTNAFCEEPFSVAVIVAD